MKVYVSGDEWYPVYGIKVPEGDDYEDDELMDLDPAFIKKFNEAKRTFSDLHLELSRMVDKFDEAIRVKQREAQQKIREREKTSRKQKNKGHNLAMRKDHLERHWPLCSGA